MPQVSVIAKLTAKEGKRDEVVALLRELVDSTEAEAGTLLYAMNVSKTDPEVVWFYELYTGQDALEAHGGSDAMKASSSGLRGLLAAKPELHFLEPVAAKGLPT
jgi:quinol monooxygenase YgiN